MNRRDFLKLAAAAGATVMFPSIGRAASPVRLILDTDICADCDDTADCGVVAAFCYLLEFQLLGVMVNSQNAYSAPTARAILSDYYRIPNVVYGTYNGSSVSTPGNGSTYNPGLRNQYRPGDISSNYADAVTQYRTILHGQPDNSVVILMTGFGSAVSDLLRSAADGIDLRNGVDLITAKVEELIWVAGELPGPAQEPWNVLNDIADAQYITNNWPTSVPLTWCPIQLGDSVLSGPPTSDDPDVNPVRYAFANDYPGHVNSHGKRPAWAQLGVLYAARGSGGYFSYAQQNGKVTVTDGGVTQFITSTNAGQRYLAKTLSDGVYSAMFDSFLALPPPTLPVRFVPAM